MNRTGTSPASHRARPFRSSPIPPTPPFNCCVRLCLCWPSAWPSAWPSCLAPTGCRERQGDVHRRGALGQERAGGLQATDHDLVLPLERRREERPRPLLWWPSGSSLPLKPPPPAFSRSSRTSILDYYYCVVPETVLFWHTLAGKVRKLKYVLGGDRLSPTVCEVGSIGNFLWLQYALFVLLSTRSSTPKSPWRSTSETQSSIEYTAVVYKMSRSATWSVQQSHIQTRSVELTVCCTLCRNAKKGFETVLDLLDDACRGLLEKCLAGDA